METTTTSGFKQFLLVCLGQAVSLIGTGLTSFALSVWIYRTTGSVTQFTLAIVLVTLPGTLLSPFFGLFIDRYGRRTAMLTGNLMLALRTAWLLFLVSSGSLEVWHVYVAAVVRSLGEAVHLPAYSASIALLVPKHQLGRANGFVQFGSAAAQVIGPGLAGLLMPRIAMQGLLLIDLATFLVSIGTLLAVRLPRPPQGPAADPGPLLRRAAFGWHYIRQRPGLLAVLLYFSLLNFLVGLGFVLATPLLLSFASEEELGLVLSIGSFGALLGALAMSLWGGPKRRIWGILGFSPLLGLGFLIVGARPVVPLIALGICLFYFSVPIINASSGAIWQTRVEPAMQGRVFATQRLLAQITSPLAFVLAGPLADRVFIPLLVAGGPLAGTVGRLLGVGPGRGIGLFFLLMGLLLLVATAAGAIDPRLRRVEDQPASEVQAGG